MISVGHVSGPPPTGGLSTLVWEDTQHQDAAGLHWWLARSSDAAGERDFFIVEDQIAGFLIGLVRRQQESAFTVIAAVAAATGEHPAPLAFVKDQISRWRLTPLDSALARDVRRWRLWRSWRIARANFSLACGAFLIGILLGFAVAMFAVSSGADSPPILIVGLLIGAVAGTLLKLLADRKPASIKPGERPTGLLAGAWERFTVVSFSALLGAGLASGAVLALFWY